MYLVYKTNTHHSYASRDIIGVTDSAFVAVAICKEKASKEGEQIGEDDLWNLNQISQTQSYSGEGEFQYEWIEEDVLL